MTGDREYVRGQSSEHRVQSAGKRHAIMAVIRAFSCHSSGEPSAGRYLSGASWEYPYSWAVDYPRASCSWRRWKGSVPEPSPLSPAVVGSSRGSQPRDVKELGPKRKPINPSGPQRPSMGLHRCRTLSGSLSNWSLLESLELLELSRNVRCRTACTAVQCSQQATGGRVPADRERSDAKRTHGKSKPAIHVQNAAQPHGRSSAAAIRRKMRG